MIRAAALAVSLVTATSCAAAPAPVNSQQRWVAVGGLTRTWLQVVPPACATATANCPLVFGFHGGGIRGVSGAQFDQQSKLSAAAAQRGFILVLPNAREVNWNDGRPEVGETADDVAFVKAILAAVRTEKLGIDRSRIFATGMSNGGHMSFRLACEMADTFRAIAPVAATLGTVTAARCRPARPISVLNIVGTADPISPYDGGMIRYRNGKSRGEILSSDATFAFWAKADGCRAPATRSTADADPGDGTSVITEMHVGCAGGSVVERRSIVGGGHVWPGETPKGIVAMMVGHPTRELAGTDTVLDFFGIRKVKSR